MNILSDETKSAITSYLLQFKAESEAWVAEDPQNRFAAYAEPESTIETLEKYTTVQSFEDYLAYESWLVYVDMYKEYNGIRPRGTSWSDHTSEEWMSIVKNL